MDEARTLGERVRDVRKRRGLSQRERLADRSDVSLSLVRKLEQADYGNVRLETLHKLAIALRVPTTALATGPDAADPEDREVEQWEPVRRALEGRIGEQPAEEPTFYGVTTAFRSAVTAVLGSRYAELRILLPALLRDADALVDDSVNGEQAQTRRLRSQIRQLTAYMMGQTWQFDAARDAIDLAMDDASDGPTELAAYDWKSWVLLRQGQLEATRELAAELADATEPKLSRASREELAAWGRFLLRLSTAAARDNRPGEAQDALRLARVAAVAAGSDFVLSYDPLQVFGPMTVSMIQAENAMIQGQPDVVLSIGAQLAGRSFPVPRNYLRHRLDVAHAHLALRQHGEAVGVLQEVRQAAPEWLAQQRYAGDILTEVIARRRSLTPQMRELADHMRLAL